MCDAHSDKWQVRPRPLPRRTAAELGVQPAGAQNMRHHAATATATATGSAVATAIATAFVVSGAAVQGDEAAQHAAATGTGDDDTRARDDGDGRRSRGGNLTRFTAIMRSK